MLRRLPVDTQVPASEHPLDAAVVDELIAAEHRPGTPDAPWVAVNMATTADGAIAIDGVSGPIGGPGDTAVFVALRAMADVILVGSATATAERYRPPMGNAERRARRVARGQAPLPRLAVVSNRGDIDLSLPMFVDAGSDRRPIVVAANAIDPARRHAVEEVADLVVAGDDRVDLRAAIALLGRTCAASVVLVEGGATINGLLLDADLVDEWCITIAPSLIGGVAPRAAAGAGGAHLRRMRLDRAFESDGDLILRYVRDR